MSKEMENHSFNERTISLTGNSGILGLSSIKPSVQPIRIKALMDMYGSDEEDSEDKGKDSSDSECDDIQPLPEDEDVRELQNSAQPSAKLDECPTPVVEEISSAMLFPVPEVSLPLTHENIALSVPAIKLDQPQDSPPKESKINEMQHVRNSLSMHFTNNFSDDDQSRKSQIQGGASISSEALPHLNFQADRSIPKSLILTNRRSNIEFEVPDGSNEKSTLSGILKIEPMNYSSGTHVGSNEKLLHSSILNQPEPISGGSSILQAVTPGPHRAIDTPLKNNPPLGSMRPTPSLSHRSIFQTPQNSKLRQDYSKNHVQTPATIFGNWSQKHMAQTPLQDHRSVSCDSLRSAMPPILPHGTHDIPKCIGIEKQRVRRPLAESIQSNHHCQNEKLSYNVESSSTKINENQNRGVLEVNNDRCSNKPVILMQHGTKENRHPVEKLASVEEPLKRRISECIKEMESNSKETRENRSKVPIGNSLIYENPENYRPSRSVSATSSSTLVDEKLSYNVEPSSLKTHEHQKRGLLETISDKCSNKPVILVQHRTEENRHTIEKSASVEELPRRRIFESVKEMRPSLKETRENRSNVLIGDSQIHENPENIRVSRSVSATSGYAPATEKKNISERPNNVQLSIPSRTRGLNRGQTMSVKGREYLVLGVVGEGMSGQVLRVQDIETLELRAIKVVNLSRMDKDCAQGCLQEISMLHKLQAPCVVRMFDHEIKYPMVHVVLEIGDTDFRSLLNSMSEKKRLPLTMILYYWTEMLTAVKHIHDNGVIHSDLKPANFLLVRGRLKLIDFGIASSLNADMTSVVKNSTTGTLNYISPEALMDTGGNGDSPNRSVKYKITFKSDVWSLGCILYGLVYGYTPFHNIRAQWAKVSAITNPDFKISFPPPSGNDVEPIPPVLIDVMRKCLQHDPKARPTAAQLLQIPYIPVKQNLPNPASDIPSNILMKIKYSLTDSEWRQFTEIMETRRNQS